MAGRQEGQQIHWRTDVEFKESLRNEMLNKIKGG